MDILQLINLENLNKRFWRRRRYTRLVDSTNNKRKLKIARLGNKKQRRFWKIRLAPKLRLKFVSPIKLFHKFNNACVDAMIRLIVVEDIQLYAGQVKHCNSVNKPRDATQRLPIGFGLDALTWRGI